ncbi:MAG: type I secretion C-terminal target domain-containing protein, partial [Azovibrio sp.]
EGGAGNDILHGGLGNDTLTGGIGADEFVWHLADRGTLGAPAVDTIKDFEMNTQGELLDLKDILVGETHTAGSVGNLSDYLHFEQSGNDTVIHISSTGGFKSGYDNGSQEDQTIVLQNVDVTEAGAYSTDNEIIRQLLDHGKLIVD